MKQLKLKQKPKSRVLVRLSPQMQQWFNVDGERHLLEAESVKDPGDRMEQVLNSFTGFLIEANVSFSSPAPLLYL